MSPATARTPSAIPTPIPAFAPVLRPPLLDGVDDDLGDDVGDDVGDVVEEEVGGFVATELLELVVEVDCPTVAARKCLFSIPKEQQASDVISPQHHDMSVAHWLICSSLSEPPSCSQHISTVSDRTRENKNTCRSTNTNILQTVRTIPRRIRTRLPPELGVAPTRYIILAQAIGQTEVGRVGGGRRGAVGCAAHGNGPDDINTRLILQATDCCAIGVEASSCHNRAAGKKQQRSGLKGGHCG